MGSAGAGGDLLGSGGGAVCEVVHGGWLLRSARVRRHVSSTSVYCVHFVAIAFVPSDYVISASTRSHHHLRTRLWARGVHVHMRGLIASTTGMGRSVEIAEKQGISRTRRTWCGVWTHDNLDGASHAASTWQHRIALL